MKTDETEYDNSGIQGLEIKDENWIEDIKMVFNEIDFKYPFPDPDTELFYTIIWNKSLEAFDSPREVQVIVDAEDQTTTTDEFGPDLRQTVVYSFMRDTSIEADFRPEIGDIIDWNHAHWEINSINENQLIGGKYDENFSVVCNTHLIRKSALNIERIRSI